MKKNSSQLNKPAPESNQPVTQAFSPYMEKLQNKLDIRNLKNQADEHMNFWKGLILGTMAGMTITAFTYAIVDPAIKEPARKREASAPKLRSHAAA